MRLIPGTGRGLFPGRYYKPLTNTQKSVGLSVFPSESSHNHAQLIDAANEGTAQRPILSIQQNKTVIHTSAVSVNASDCAGIVDRGASGRNGCGVVDLGEIAGTVAQKSMGAGGLIIYKKSDR